MRHLRALPRNPELLMFATIQPLMFVVLFVYVFGGSVNTPIDYTQYVIPGIFTQTVLFNSAFTSVGMADDLEQGHHRPPALAADVSRRGAHRAHVLGHRAQRDHVRRDVRRRLRGRVPHRGHDRSKRSPRRR